MLTKNKNVLDWVDEMAALTKPDKIVWLDGSEEQLSELRDQAIATGEMERLNEEKLPAACCTEQRSTTWPGWREEPSSAPEKKKMQVPPTTGKTRRSCIQN